jgi:hypothetical protein
MLTSGSYGADGSQYRTELESFSEIIAHGQVGNGPAWFEVHTKSGQIMQFGNTTDSQVLGLSTGTVRSWGVNKVSDTKGNYFTVTYANDTNPANHPGAVGQAYPTRIDYTGNANASLATYNSVQFFYATRPDTILSYQAGAQQETNQRLTDIKTYNGTSLVLDYHLDYQTAGASSRSEIAKATLIAADGSQLPPTTFTWQGHANFWGTNLGNPAWGGFGIIPGNFHGLGFSDVFVQNPASSGLYYEATNGVLGPTGFAPGQLSDILFLGDFNGDGLTDIFLQPTANQTAGVWLSNGNGGFTASSFTPSGWGPSVYSFQAVDLNGDGCTDLFAEGATNGISATSFLSDCHGNFTGTGISFSGWTANNYNFVFGDFNGDGKADVMQQATFSGGVATMLIGDGTGNFVSTGFTPGWNSQLFQMIPGDFNGDGKTDLLLKTVVPNTPSALCLSNGANAFVCNPNFGPVGWDGYNVITGDFNGDGCTDILLQGKFPGMPTTLYLSDCNGNFVAGPSVASGWDASAYTIYAADWNGEGATSLWLVQPGMGGATQKYATDFVPDLMTGVTTGLGATTTISYDRLNDNPTLYTKDSTAVYPVQDFEGPLYVVSQVSASNGIGGTHGATYSYVGAKADVSGRGFLGFRQMVVNDLQTGITQTTTYQQTFPEIGLVATKTKTLGSQLLESTTNSYQFTNKNGTINSVGTPSATAAPYQVSPQQSVESSYDLDGSVIPPVTTTYQYDNYGNATQIAVSTPDGHSKTTNNTYTNDTTNWFLGRLTNASVTSVTP